MFHVLKVKVSKTYTGLINIEQRFKKAIQKKTYPSYNDKKKPKKKRNIEAS